MRENRVYFAILRLSLKSFEIRKEVIIFQDFGDEQTKSKQEINQLKESLRKEEGLRQELANELEKKSEV